MVLDRQNKIIYACKSPRTSEIVLNELSKNLVINTVYLTLSIRVVIEFIIQMLFVL